MGYELASISLAPLFYLQGRYVQRVTPRLPEPPGARSGSAGVGPPLRIVIVGDSAAAGVGAASQDEALSGRLVADLATTYHLSWTLVARTGATTAATARYLSRQSAASFDIAVLALGGNDVLRRRPREFWLSDMKSLLDLLRTQFSVRHFLLNGLPPMHAFPAFPQPLRWYLGSTARRFDEDLARWSATQPDCDYLPLPLSIAAAAEQLASDGFHPGPLAYRQWSTELARRIRYRCAGGFLAPMYMLRGRSGLIDDLATTTLNGVACRREQRPAQHRQGFGKRITDESSNHL
jgi:lysophospholipase L1-like esterase